MRLRNTLAIAMLSLAASVSLTGCGDKNQPLTEAQMQRKQQELQIQAQQQQLDIQRAQAQADLDAQRLQNKAMQQQMLPPQQPVYQPQPTYSAPAVPAVPAVPVQHVDTGIGAGTALIGAAAVGAAGYAIGKSASNNQQYNSGNNYNNSNYNRAQPTTRVLVPAQQVQRPAYVPPKPAYQAPVQQPKKTAGFTRLGSTPKPRR